MQVTNPPNVNLSQVVVDAGLDLSGGDYDIIMKAGRTVDGEDISALDVVESNTVRPWHGAISAIPSGYVLCDGGSGTPNLTDRFVIHADSDGGGTRDVGDIGGAMSHTLAIAQLASHAHNLDVGYTGSGNSLSAGSCNSDAHFCYEAVSSSGSGNSHSILNKYYAMAMIMKT